MFLINNSLLNTVSADNGRINKCEDEKAPDRDF